MKFEPLDSLKTTFWGLLIIWLVGLLLVLFTTRIYYLGFFYGVIVGSIFALIYHVAKAEKNNELCRKDDSKQGWWQCSHTPKNDD